MPACSKCPLTVEPAAPEAQLLQASQVAGLAPVARERAREQRIAQCQCGQRRQLPLGWKGAWQAGGTASRGGNVSMHATAERRALVLLGVLLDRGPGPETYVMRGTTAGAFSSPSIRVKEMSLQGKGTAHQHVT